MKRICAGGLFALSAFASSAVADESAWTPTVFNLDNGMKSLLFLTIARPS